MSELTILLDYIKTHIEADARQFESIDKKLDAIVTDVRSLLESRSFTRGISKAAVAVAGTVAALVGGAASAVVAWVLK